MELALLILVFYLFILIIVLIYYNRKKIREETNNNNRLINDHSLLNEVPFSSMIGVNTREIVSDARYVREDSIGDSFNLLPSFIYPLRWKRNSIYNTEEYNNLNHDTKECLNCEKGIIGYSKGKVKYGCVKCGHEM